MNFYKDKLRERFNPKSKFESELSKAKTEQSSTDIKHVNNEYIMDNRDILFSAINNHKFKNNIHVIDFFNFDKNFYKFVEGDIFSHPTDTYYLKKFWPKIFEAVLK